MSRITVGRIVGVFGVHGEVRCKPTAVGEETLAVGLVVHRAVAPTELRVVARREVAGKTVLRFEGIDDPERAATLLGSEIAVDRARVVLAPGEFLDEDLVGLHLIDLDGRELGRVAAIEHHPTNECLVLAGGRGLVPLIRAFVREVDLPRGRIVVDLPPGLVDESPQPAGRRGRPTTSSGD